MIIQIKTAVIEWIQERLNLDPDEALELAQEFVGMLYTTGAFIEPQTPAEAEEDRAANESRDASRQARWG